MTEVEMTGTGGVIHIRELVDELRSDLIRMLADRASEEGAEPYTETDIVETADAVIDLLKNRETT